MFGQWQIAFRTSDIVVEQRRRNLVYSARSRIGAVLVGARRPPPPRRATTRRRRTHARAFPGRPRGFVVISDGKENSAAQAARAAGSAANRLTPRLGGARALVAPYAPGRGSEM